MTSAAFTASEITVNGKTFPAQYTISPTGIVYDREMLTNVLTNRTEQRTLDD